MQSPILHPDLVGFIATAALPASIYLASRDALASERSVQMIVLGTLWIAIGALLDFLEHVPRVVQALPVLGTADANWIISAVFILPGAALTAWGIIRWLPLVGTMAREISRRKRTDQALRRSEDRFRVMVESAPEAITMIDAETGIFVEVNPAAAELHGYSREELVGKHTPWSLSPNEQAGGRPSSEVGLAHLARARAGETPHFEWMHVTPAGERRICEVSLVRLPAEHNRLIRACVVDVTERREEEKALRRAQRMEALAILSSGAAHDFNNTLGVISGCAELLEGRGSEDLELKDSILRAAARGTDLTRRLQEIARERPSPMACIAVGDVLEPFADMLRRTLGTRFDVQTEISPTLWKTVASLGELEDGLLNLTLNSRDAMPDGGRLSLEAHNRDLDIHAAKHHPGASPGSYVAISVTDSGSGMTAEAARRAFEPFFTTKDMGSGTGLGLAMVRSFAAQMNGFVELDSEIGQGTRVTIHLPRCLPGPVPERSRRIH